MYLNGTSIKIGLGRLFHLVPLYNTVPEFLLSETHLQIIIHSWESFPSVIYNLNDFIINSSVTSTIVFLFTNSNKSFQERSNPIPYACLSSSRTSEQDWRCGPATPWTSAAPLPQTLVSQLEVQQLLLQRDAPARICLGWCSDATDGGGGVTQPDLVETMFSSESKFVNDCISTKIFFINFV